MNAKKLCLALLVLVLASSFTFAQSSSGRTVSRYLLTINSNAPNSQVFINAVRQNGTTPMRLTLNQGTYSVTVRADGYRDYVANINLTRNLTLNAALQADTNALTVTSNVQGSKVIINNQERGVAPVRVNLQAGRYSVRVTAEGHKPYNQIVNLSRDTTVNATLEPILVGLTVTSNAAGAKLYIDGNFAGELPLRLNITPATYSIQVVAPNYYNYNQRFVVAADTTIDAILPRSTVDVTFEVPDRYLNPSVSNPLLLFDVYIDGRKIANPHLSSFMVDVGKHIVRVETGGLSFEAEFMFEAHEFYSLIFDILILLRPIEALG
ncbi:MAG: PEGA domain-containing protein [Spirochaetales bacterium]|jgi:hypothetical protein|nr:PEGA domain-containing protein [Spirochaetales bacterium]